MKFTCLKTVFPFLLKKLRKPPPPHTHTQAALSLTPHNEDTCSASLKYYMQDITVNNYHFISLKIIMLVFIT